MARKKGNHGKPKGNAPPLPSLRALLNVAFDYNVGAGVLQEQIEIGLRTQNGQRVAPGSFIILAALHMELLLKALLLTSGATAREHDLLKLFNMLAGPERQALEKEFEVIRGVTKTKLTLVETLTHAKDAFVRFRYAHEMTSEANLRIDSMRDAATALEARVRAVSGEPLEPPTPLATRGS